MKKLLCMIAAILFLALVSSAMIGCSQTADTTSPEKAAERTSEKEDKEDKEPSDKEDKEPSDKGDKEPSDKEDKEPSEKEDEQLSGKSYAELLFDPSVVHTVDVTISDADWTDLKANPLGKTKYIASVFIDGESLENVSFSTKGDTSLKQVVEDTESDRYSFKINFGKIIKGQTYHGLNKLHLNSCYADATYMKDYISYEIFRRTGVAAPLISYVWLSVNGEPRGLYTAIEDVSEAFLDRTADGKGMLYKPEKSKYTNIYGEEVESDQGASLLYIDDNISSYPNIFDNAETKADDEDKLRVVSALKALSEGTDVSGVLYADEVIRYFAAHNFLMNFDSYNSSMLHNYYLYEGDGKLAMVPWDYNMAFGCFSDLPGLAKYIIDPTPLINMGIDSPLVEVQAEERPMWRWIAEDDSARQLYHTAVDSLLSDHIESGECEELINALQEKLLPYVEKDPTAFYSVEEFNTGVQAMKQFLKLRAASVRAQLAGTLSADTGSQNPEDWVDASGLNLFLMGGQDMQ